MTNMTEFRKRVKFYESVRGLSFRDALEAALQEAINAERERCAKVIENGSFLHDQSPAALFAKEAAAAIRRGT